MRLLFFTRGIVKVAIQFLLLVLCFALPLHADAPQPDTTIQIPMRDGMLLDADIYLPEPSARGLPCILVRTPWGKQFFHEAFAPLAKAGFVIVIQNTRCIQNSHEVIFPYLHDGWGSLKDGYDTVEWLAASEWTNGKIGTIGFSAMGITQLLMAPTAPPHLVTQYIGMAAPALHTYALFHGGQLLKDQVEGWLKQSNHDLSMLEFVKNQVDNVEFWQQNDAQKVVGNVQVSGFFYGGWFDTFIQGTLDAFTARQIFGGGGARDQQKMIIGPWTHHWPLSTKLGEFDIPENARTLPIEYSVLSWFIHYLGGVETGADLLPPVTYYVMGPFDGTPSKGNLWKTSDQWPVKAENRNFYLSSEHTLTAALDSESNTLQYIYDPADPTPTIGGRNLYLPCGPKDQQYLDERSDGISFTSEPLQEDLEATGRLYAKLFVSCDVPDTDVSVRVCDYYPDGRAILVCEGLQRLKTATACSPGTASLCKDNPRYVEVDLLSTSIVFAKGHRIRIYVNSANYPRYEKNFNVADKHKYIGRPPKAEVAIHMGRDNPSHIVLPIVN